jgi:hypothetical protein
MRIFIGMDEVAGFSKNYALGLRTLGHDVYTVVNYMSFYQDFKYDRVLKGDLAQFLSSSWLRRLYLGLSKKLQLAFLMFWALKNFDLFIFLFGTSFFPGCLDYPILKLFRKKIVCVFLGSEIRYGPAVKAEMEQEGIADEIRPFINYINSNPETNLSRKLNMIKMTEKYADLILSQPGYGQLQSRPYMRANVPIDLSGIPKNIPGRDIPLIIHAPTRWGIKGTEYILSAVEELRKEGILFDFRLIEKMPNHELKMLLADADIVIDDLFADTIGVLSLESLAAGNVVLVHYPEEFAKVPVGCPAINITMFNFKDKLRQIILDKDQRNCTALKGRPYVAKFHDHIAVSNQILNWLRPGGISTFDFTPTFYKAFKATEYKKGRNIGYKISA